MTKDRLIIARHGKPALSRSLRLNWRGFVDWWQQYDDGGLAEGQAAPPPVAKLAREADLVIASSLRRARETAELAHGEDVDELTDLLVEAPLPPPRIPLWKFSPSTWGVLARIVWYYGYAGGEESHAESRERASEAAAYLSNKAKGGKTIFAAAHGWFNRMMRPELLARGWTCVEDRGDKHWSYRVYERPTRLGADDE